MGADRVGFNPPSPVLSPRENNSKSTPPVQKSLAIPLPAPSPTSTLQRRWSQTQAKDFYDLHTTLATMILHCDLQVQSSSVIGCDVNTVRLPTPPEVRSVLYGHSSIFYFQVIAIKRCLIILFISNRFYIQELVVACCHSNNISDESSLIRMMLYIARGQLDFSRTLLRETLVCLI